jgi:23S rRNA (uracil1939-C5)-methyltransferase
MQHLADSAYRDWKRGLVIYALRHLNIAPEIIGKLQVSKPNSRRRASFSALRRGRKTLLGFMQRGTHAIVDMQVCFVLQPAIVALVETLRALNVLREGESVSYLVTCLDGALEVLIERKRPLDLAERERLAEFAEAQGLARLAWRNAARDTAEPVAYREPLLARFGEATVPLPPGAFLQATGEGEAALVAAVLAGLPQGPVIDLFAGCGTFSFPAAMRGPVTAYEGNAEAVAAVNAARYPQVKALQRNLFSDPVTSDELKGFAAAIFDPPYAGAAAQVAELAESKLETIIGVSCNPQSFARDAAVLIEGGYKLMSVMPVDQFLWSADVELVGTFKKLYDIK